MLLMRRSAFWVIFAFALAMNLGKAQSAETAGCPADPPQTDYPDRPITIITPTSPGSGGAQYTVLMAESMQTLFGQPVEVVYKPAGANNAAAVQLDQADADGYTLSIGHGSLAGYMNLPTFTPDPEHFAYIAQTEKQLFALAVPSSSQFKSMQDVITYAKLHPGELALGSTKVGSLHHKHIINLEKAAGVKFRYTPYQGSGEIAKDVIGGHISIGLGQPGIWLPHVQAGKVRMLLLLNEERISALPDVPVPADLGYKYPFSHQWYGLMVKKGAPADRIAKLQWAIGKVVASEAYVSYVSRNAHVVPDLICDEAFLTERMREDVLAERAFMRENGLLK